MPKTTPTGPQKDAAARERTAHIDELMGLPIKGRPQITVVGDDAVSGINALPAPPKAAD